MAKERYIVFACKACNQADMSILRKNVANVSGKILKCRRCFKSQVFNSAKILDILENSNEAVDLARHVNVTSLPLPLEKQKILEKLGRDFYVNEANKIAKINPEPVKSKKEIVFDAMKNLQERDGFIDEDELFKELKKTEALESEKLSPKEKFESIISNLNTKGDILQSGRGKYKLME